MNTHNPKFWSYDSENNKLVRDFSIEKISKKMTVLRYWEMLDGLDNNNYMYYENFDMYDEFGSIGCEYERMECVIGQGDVVVDIGANIGMFSRRAIERGCSKLICIEPTTRAFSCLIDNIPYSVATFNKFAIGKENGILDIGIDTSALGGSSLFNVDKCDYNEKVPVFNINFLWEASILPDTVDFMKIDSEGGEQHIIDTITDTNLNRIKKGSMEYHISFGSEEHYYEFIIRLEGLGYNHFTKIFSSNDKLLNFWK